MIVWSDHVEVKQLLGRIFKQILTMTVLEGKITDTFICTSFVLQILTGSAKQDHFEHEPFCISHTKKKKVKKVFTFLHLLSLS